MFLSLTSRSAGVAVVAAATVLLGACGGGGGSSSSASANSSVIKLSSAVQSEHVARYAGAFGMLSGPGVAAIYTSVVQSFVSKVSAGTASTTTNCPTSGSVGVATTNAGAAGMQTGETATVSFNQCTGQVKAPGVSSDALVTGTVNVQIQSVQGVVGSSTGNWSYTATETANNLTMTSANGTTVVSGTVTFTMSYDAKSGTTTTTASAPTVTLNRTQQAGSGSISGNITITGLTYSRLHGTNPSSDTLSTAGNISVNAADATIAFSVSTPTPVTVSDGNVQQGVIQLTTSDTVETITASNSTSVNISVTSNGQTGTYTESVDDFRSLAGG
jgi:hypothetical protein